MLAQTMGTGTRYPYEFIKDVLTRLTSMPKRQIREITLAACAGTRVRSLERHGKLPKSSVGQYEQSKI